MLEGSVSHEFVYSGDRKSRKLNLRQNKCQVLFLPRCLSRVNASQNPYCSDCCLYPPSHLTREPESSQTPTPHPSSLPSHHQHLQLVTHRVLSVCDLKSGITNRDREDKLNIAGLNEVCGLVGRWQTGEQIPF